MANDGDIDYSKYTNAELREARLRIDQNRYPLNFTALNRETLRAEAGGRTAMIVVTDEYSWVEASIV
jgi:hypothetical protein